MQALDAPVKQQEELKQAPVEEEKKELVEPKTRAAGGVWLLASDFPHSFQHLIVYHNLGKFAHVASHQDRWSAEPSLQPYLVNERDVLLRLELDAEALHRLQREHRGETQSPDQSALEQPLDESRAEPGALLPGEVTPPPPAFDQVLLAFAPFPSNKPAPTLPRYLMKLSQVDSQNDAEEQKPIEVHFKSYLEGKLVTLPSDQPVIWLRPNLVAPLGFALWAGGVVRKISVVPRAEYLVQQRQFHLKTYQSDFPPLERGRYHLFAKFDFHAPEALLLNLRLDVPGDKHLLAFMRLKLVDKSKTARKYQSQTEAQALLGVTRLENLPVAPNGGKGYCLVVEGVAPYNTTEGQLQLEVLADLPAFALEEVQHVEPLEYSDRYAPSKYGVIFREKVFVGPDHTAAALHVTLKR